MHPEIAVILSDSQAFRRISLDLSRRGVLVCRASSMAEVSGLVSRIPVSFVVIADRSEHIADLQRLVLPIPVLLLPPELAQKKYPRPDGTAGSRTGNMH